MGNGHRKTTGVAWLEVGISLGAWVALTVTIIPLVAQSQSTSAMMIVTVCQLIIGAELLYGLVQRAS